MRLNYELFLREGAGYLTDEEELFCQILSRINRARLDLFVSTQENIFKRLSKEEFATQVDDVDIARASVLIALVDFYFLNKLSDPRQGLDNKAQFALYFVNALLQKLDETSIQNEYFDRLDEQRVEVEAQSGVVWPENRLLAGAVSSRQESKIDFSQLALELIRDFPKETKAGWWHKRMHYLMLIMQGMCGDQPTTFEEEGRTVQPMRFTQSHEGVQRQQASSSEQTAVPPISIVKNPTGLTDIQQIATNLSGSGMFTQSSGLVTRASSHTNKFALSIPISNN